MEASMYVLHVCIKRNLGGGEASEYVIECSKIIINHEFVKDCIVKRTHLD